MSRVLADLLGTNRPAFDAGLKELERAAGDPRADIRLTVQIEQEVRAKLQELGLDPANTTGPELFRALEERLLADEAKVRQALSLSGDVSTLELLKAVQKLLDNRTNGDKVFAMKPTVMRAILKKLKPKATMKALGYRSMDSMFKHEQVTQLLVATQLIEDAEWNAARLAAYRKLQAKDFELRHVAYELPTTKKWPELAAKYTAKFRHNIITVHELGGVVIMPLEIKMNALAIVSIVLGLQAYDDIRARSALLKLHQVQPTFGEVLHDAIEHEPMTDLEIGGGKLSWKLTHWFYGSGLAPYYPDLFEPHLQPDDFELHDVHATLESLNTTLSFWRGSHMLGLLDQARPVSFNILDVALGVCNRLGYANRLVHNMREALGRELFVRYLHHENVQAILEETLATQLNPEPEIAFDE